ncbi:MAG TPA: hypothetical protein VFS08_17245 [Gemmatimonadaceae bacterium]|nr:hypothetical protein [Gemmatimonadaceae bacterium]
MGGKRPDQYQIDPGEAGATDYKDRRTSLNIGEQEKEKFAQERAEERESLIPRHEDNPALAEMKARTAQRQHDQAVERGESEGDEGAGDERA